MLLSFATREKAALLLVSFSRGMYLPMEMQEGDPGGGCPCPLCYCTPAGALWQQTGGWHGPEKKDLPEIPLSDPGFQSNTCFPCSFRGGSLCRRKEAGGSGRQKKPKKEPDPSFRIRLCRPLFTLGTYSFFRAFSSGASYARCHFSPPGMMRISPGNRSRISPARLRTMVSSR